MSDTQHRPIMWSTIEEYEGDPEVLARQGGGDWNSKPEGFAEKLENLELPEIRMRRRTFMKMGGFATVLAMAAGCQKPAEVILPYVTEPEEVTPGVPNYYASSCGGCSVGCGLVVKTYESRPIKLEGNANHPVNEGTLCSRGQSSLIELYDPDRLRDPIRVANRTKVEWETVDAEVAEALQRAGDKAVLLTGVIHGPARRAAIETLKRTFPGLRHVVYEPLAGEERLESREMLFGSRELPRYRFEKAEVTAIFGSDLIADTPSPHETNRNFGLSRKVRKNADGSNTMGRTYAFEPLITGSGMNADFRFPLRPSEMLPVALAVANQLRTAQGASTGGINLPSSDVSDVERSANLPTGTIERLAADLWEHRGRSIVYTGGPLSRTEDALQLHLVVDLLNVMLGNEGETIDSSRPGRMDQGSTAEILALIEEMNAGDVEVLLLAGANPAYALPESAGFSAALQQVGLKVSFDTYPNETAGQCDYILSGTHYLESWGDTESYAGVYGLRQPVIGKLWNNRQFEDSLIQIAVKGGNEELLTPVFDEFGDPVLDDDGEQRLRPKTFHEMLKETWRAEIFDRGDFAGAFQQFWFDALRRGVIEFDAPESAARSIRGGAAQQVSAALGRQSASPSGMELAAYVTANTYDGRHANNPWQLELPDPVNRICWDNLVCVAPATAREHRLRDGDIVRVTANGASVEGPIYRAPGMHPGVIAVQLGWGRTAAGAVGDGEGFNAWKLGAADNGRVLYSGASATFEKTGRTTRLANVQGHNYMQLNPRSETEYKRTLVQSTSLDAYNENPSAPQGDHHIPHWKVGQPIPSIWNTRDFKYPRHKWAMSIDLNVCTGCNACMVACQAENNIPVVGKREVLVGREMHWIRIDRYFKGDLDYPEVVKQPMLCQHCDNAPCETVCPVLATVHSDEGINQQIYNRCVGTRYCANNCPYKVRRFNYYEYSRFRKGPHHELRRDAERDLRQTPLVLALNPEITVRTKGIMEKCTFCQQRIRQARYDMKAQGRNLRDGELKTACQQSCPTEAIVFGDVNNPEHEIAKVREEHSARRGYRVLEEFAVEPSVMYLAHIWNRETKPHDDIFPYTLEYLHGKTDEGEADSPDEARDATGATRIRSEARS